MASSRILDLASIIHEHTRQIDEYLSSNGLQSPSFDVSSPRNLPSAVEVSQSRVLEAMDELNALLLGPVRYVASHPHNTLTSVQAIQRFNIATSFPVGSTASFDEIASKCSLSVSDTKRIVRHAMTHYMFKESSKGVVMHTAASKALAEIPPLRQLTGFMTTEMWPSATRVVDAMEKWPASQEPNEAGFNLANDTDKQMMDFVNQTPERAEQMAGAMTFTQSGPAYSVEHILNNHDWGDAVHGKLVDVGGSVGAVTIQIARRFPGMQCVVQDLPEVIAGAKVPEDLEGRLSFMAHNFFAEQPVKDADLYLLRWILHDWADKYAMRILRNLIPALKKGAKILVCELCMPQPGVLSPYRERSARLFDLAMKGIQNAKERDADDWAELFAAADPRFKLGEIVKPSGSALSIIEAQWSGDDPTCTEDVVERK